MYVGYEDDRKSARHLYHVGIQFALTHLRRCMVEAKDVSCRTPPLEDDPEKLAGRGTFVMLNESIDHLAEQISLLSPALRQVIVMRYLRGIEPSEIIDRLAISASEYEQRLTSAKHQLRQRLREIGVDPPAF